MVRKLSPSTVLYSPKIRRLNWIIHGFSPRSGEWAVARVGFRVRVSVGVRVRLGFRVRVSEWGPKVTFVWSEVSVTHGSVGAKFSCSNLLGIDIPFHIRLFRLSITLPAERTYSLGNIFHEWIIHFWFHNWESLRWFCISRFNLYHGIQLCKCLFAKRIMNVFASRRKPMFSLL